MNKLSNNKTLKNMPDTKDEIIAYIYHLKNNTNLCMAQIVWHLIQLGEQERSIPYSITPLKLNLIFDDWQNEKGESVYNTELGIELSSGDLHNGTTFECSVDFGAEDIDLIKHAKSKGVHPVFRLEVSSNE